jgi:thiamine biosynthesis lipoprotein
VTTALGSVHRRVEQVMGLPISCALRGRHTTDAAAEIAWAAAVATLREADRVFSTYRPDSAVSRLRRGELTVADCPPEVREVLDLADRARTESGGAFDVVRPGPDGRPELDPAGIVKGWATERAAAALLRLPDTDVCLSAGGDMVCHVADPDDPPWRIGIEDPAAPLRTVAVVRVHRGAVATSGAAHRGPHVIDPRTGGAPTGLASVTVIADSLTDADVDATAALVLGDRALTWLVDRGRRGVLVDDDGRIETFGNA